MYDLECPYCEEEMEVPEDCQGSYIPYTHECPQCKETFVSDPGYGSILKRIDADVSKGIILSGKNDSFQNGLWELVGWINHKLPETAKVLRKLLIDKKGDFVQSPTEED